MLPWWYSCITRFLLEALGTPGQIRLQNPVYKNPLHDLMVISYDLILGHHELMMRFGVDWVTIPNSVPEHGNMQLVRVHCSFGMVTVTISVKSAFIDHREWPFLQ